MSDNSPSPIHSPHDVFASPVMADGLLGIWNWGNTYEPKWDFAEGEAMQIRLSFTVIDGKVYMKSLEIGRVAK